MLKERGAPLAGDSSRSSREDNLLAKGVALERDYEPVSVSSRRRAAPGRDCGQCCLLTGGSPLMREDRRRGVAILSEYQSAFFRRKSIRTLV